MTELKSAEDWIEEAKNSNPNGINEISAAQFIQLIQQNAINAALELAQADVRNKLSSISNLLSIMKSSKQVLCIDNKALFEIVESEQQNCHTSIKYLSESVLSLTNHPKLKV